MILSKAIHSSSLPSCQSDVRSESYDKWFTGLMISSHSGEVEKSKEPNNTLLNVSSSSSSPVNTVSSMDVSQNSVILTDKLHVNLLDNTTGKRKKSSAQEYKI